WCSFLRAWRLGSNSNGDLLQHLMPVLCEAVDMKALQRGAARAFAETPRFAGIAQQTVHHVRQRVDVGVHEAVLAIADHGAQFGGRETDDGHADGHRLDDRKAETRPANRVEKEAIARAERSEI